MDTFNGWYVGDPTARKLGPLTHPAQMNGGILGMGARAVYGRPQQGEQRSYLHSALPADLATLSADYCLGEMPRFVVPGLKRDEGGTVERTKLQDRIEKVINTAEVHAMLLEGAELQSALGGVFFRLVWDRDRLDAVQLDVVHADAAIPRFLFGQLHDVTFWSELPAEGDDGTVWRHLELHEAGAIEHALFEGTQDELGTRRPVQDHPSTEWLATVLNGDSQILTGLDKRLTATYIPNMLPNGKHRKSAHLSRLGKSDYAGITDLFEKVDTVWSSWMRDIRLAKARIIVPRAYLSSNGFGQGASFDADREVYEAIDALTGPQGNPIGITPQQFAIRVDEHERTIKALTDKAMRSAGWSPGSLGGSESGVRTATEVESDDQLSRRTRDKKLNYWRRLSDFALTWMLLDSQLYGGEVPQEAPDVKFPAEAQVDVEKLARTASALYAAQSASIETRVRLVNPDWDGETVNTEVERIKAEHGIGVAADPTVTGIPDDRPDVERLRDKIESGGEASKEQADALGVLVRAGVDPADAARRAGLSGVKFTGMTPVALRPVGEE